MAHGFLKRARMQIRCMLAIFTVFAVMPMPSIALYDETSSNRPVIDEIIVTAQKREESILEVPVSLQAFSPAMLDQRGITDQSGLMRSVPSLDVATQTGFTTLFLRGIGTDAYLTADPSVASYIDGVYYPFTPSIVQDFGAIDRVEVLKGPQGTLFGRNAVGGAINIWTKDPDLARPETAARISYSRFDTYKSRAYTNIPLSDRLGLNLSALYSSGEPYFDENSTSGGEPLHRDIHKGARAKLRSRPVDNVDLVLSATLLDDRDNGSLPSNYYVSPLGRALLVPAAKGDTANVDLPLYRHFTSRVLAMQGKTELAWFDVRVNASQQRHTQDYLYDYDGSVRPIAGFVFGDGAGDGNGGLFADIKQAELQVVSNAESFGSSWLTYNLGVFYFKGRSGLDPANAVIANVTAGSLAGFGFPAPLLNALDAIQLPAGLSLPGQPGHPLYSLLSHSYTDTVSFAEYVQITAKLSEKVALTLGGRYQDEERSVPRSTTAIELQTGAYFQAFNWKQGRDQNGRLIPLENTTKGFKPKLTLEYHPFANETLLYATYQEAVKSATYNSYAIYLPPEFVKPEEIEAYEVGLKTLLFDGLLQFSAAAWDYNIDNPQVQFVSFLNGGAVSFENAQNAKSRGIDFDLTALLFPATIDDLAVTLNSAYVKAYFGKYINASGYAPEDEGAGLGLFSAGNDYSGNRMQRVPRYTASVALSKTWRWSTARDTLQNPWHGTIPSDLIDVDDDETAEPCEWIRVDGQTHAQACVSGRDGSGRAVG